jgi:hypothetical protein
VVVGVRVLVGVGADADADVAGRTLSIRRPRPPRQAPGIRDADGEGSGMEGRDAVRFYAIARASAIECAAVLDALESLGLVEASTIDSMLTKMRMGPPEGAGHGAR